MVITNISTSNASNGNSQYPLSFQRSPSCAGALAMLHALADGGEIEILERPGGGARFVVHLPVREGQDVREAQGGGAWRGS